ncbi:restriction endonuclease subunit M [Burkholderia gladioli]|uniref:restriction endonuclease subunit M n=1 Tax=Burkholderia gladioli TaxID=28095 RepID=UPI0016401DCE|nr:N-6 DNA methylase [Burkholderia gladioli]
MATIGSFYQIPPNEWLFPNHGDVIDAKRRADNWLNTNGTYDGSEFSIEEFVRQWALKQLIQVYKYPIDWIGERIIIEEPVKMGSTEKEADISIKNANRRTFLYVEVKKRGISEDEFKEAERQLETYLASTHTATIGMVTDGDRVKTIRKKIDPNDFDYIPDLPSYGLEAKVRVQLVREIPAGDPSRSTGLRLLDNEYEKVLFDCHSVARDVDGLHADEALDEICKVIYAKIFDERSTTKKSAGEAFRFQTYGASNASEVASNIRVIYEEAKNTDIEIYSKRIPGYERSRGVFKSQIKLSDAALYRVAERLQEFSLIDSKADIKGRAFQKVLGPAIRAGMGQYFTPDPIVELAIRAIKPQASDLILDPFCGSAHFLTKSLQYVLEKQGGILTPHDLHEFKFFHLHGIEKSDRMVRIAMTDMMLNDDGHTNIRNQDALLSFDNYPDIIALRDDKQEDPALFDVIVTNPPFGSIMRQETMEMMGRFVLGHKKKSLPLEYLGLERSMQFLKPGGRLAIVLPEHVMKGKSTQFVRKWLESVAFIKGIFFFPEEAFTPYGAMVKTCLCILQKLPAGRSPLPSDKTFLCEVENLGYDATGRPKSGSEIQAAAEAFEREVSWQ